MLGLFKLNLPGMNMEDGAGANAAGANQATTPPPAVEEVKALPGTSKMSNPTRVKPAPAASTGKGQVPKEPTKRTSELDSRKSLAPTKTYTILTNTPHPGGSGAKPNEPPPLLYQSTGAEETAGTSVQFKSDPNRTLSSPDAPGGSNMKLQKSKSRQANLQVLL